MNPSSSPFFSTIVVAAIFSLAAVPATAQDCLHRKLVGDLRGERR
jgi:hypothetical protein